jgi:GH25 family lysozyme M1 (1,4-beta-N-acetylmuramidase)
MRGVDLSNNNDYNIIANPDGFDFFIMKVSEGATFVDTKAATWIADCKRMNRRYGVYHFFHGRGKTEALHFMNSAHAAGYNHESGNIIPFCDVETPGQGIESSVELFRDTVHHVWGTVPGFYSYGAYIIENHYTPSITNMALWYANPSGNPVPSPWKLAAITQTHVGEPLDVDKTATLPLIVTVPKVRRWMVHRDDKVVGRTIHPHLWEASHPNRFARRHHQLGFRRI